MTTTTKPESLSVGKPESKAAAKRREKAEAIEMLRKLLPPGSTVYTVLRHVSRSGMSRDIDCFCWVKQDDGKEPYKQYLSGYVATALDIPRSRKNGDWALKVGGCGMDMGFHIVHNLSYVLHGKGFECIGKGCPSNDHSNGDRDYTPHMHSAGGYSLRHEWI